MIRIQSTDITVTDASFLIDQISFGSTVDAQIQAQAALFIKNGIFEGVAIIAEELQGGAAGILVIDTNNGHAGVSQLLESRVLSLTGHAPGSPYIEQ